MRADRTQVSVLRECRRCGYVACVCSVLKHAQGCAWRLAVLDKHPRACAQHEAIACSECHSCTCGRDAA